MSHEIPNSRYEREMGHCIDLSGEEWTERLAQAPLYRKTALVHIRPAIPGEHVVTILADGSEETSNIAAEDDVVITNPGGEKQIVSLEKAVQRYDLTDTSGLFLAKGMVRAITNPFDHPISIRAPWGDLQYGGAECRIVALYDPTFPDEVSADRYIVGEKEFYETYGAYPIGTVAAHVVEPTTSHSVLEAMKEYDSKTEKTSPEIGWCLGVVGVKLSRLESGSYTIETAV